LLAGGGAAAFLAVTSHSRGRAQQAPSAGAANAAQLIPGKDQRLIGHNTKVGEIETPLQLLRNHRITPKELLFVRNNQVLDGAFSLEPAPLDDWSIELDGLVEMRKTIGARDLLRLPSVEVELVLQCSGNGRAWFSRAAKADGVQWKNGAMGNVRMRGASLASVLQQAQVTVQPAARFLAVEGADGPVQPGSADFEHSVPLQDALEKSLLVWELNGQPLPRVHGGPVRFVTPGHYATMHVKWVRRLRFETNESSNHHHAVR
jgi:DMSO/TMAO reductase YedYZ molybdopterin-dependent catalytic subunit